MKKKWVVPLVIFALLLFIPTATLAHVKWFTDVQPTKESIENILSPLFISVAILVAIILAVLTQLLPRIMEIPVLKKVDDKLDQFRGYSRIILKYGTALALIIQVFSQTLFAPEFMLKETWEYILVWIAIIFLLIPIHYATKLGAFLLLILFFNVLYDVGLFHMLDYGYRVYGGR